MVIMDEINEGSGISWICQVCPWQWYDSMVIMDLMAHAYEHVHGNGTRIHGEKWVSLV